MNLNDYHARRAALLLPSPRPTCDRCRKALQTCYCHALRPFAAPLPFVILQHPNEARNAIATARMAHLSMTNSTLISDWFFSKHSQVNKLLADQSRRNLLLFPSRDAMDLTCALDAATNAAANDPSASPVFWILDAKWSQVPKMLRLSPNVQAMERVKFNPEHASRFQIRRQPRLNYLSTIESIYFVIETYMRKNNLAGTEHHALIDAFRHLVQQQLEFVRPGQDTRHAAGKASRAARRQLRACQSDVVL